MNIIGQDNVFGSSPLQPIKVNQTGQKNTVNISVENPQGDSLSKIFSDMGLNVSGSEVIAVEKALGSAGIAVSGIDNVSALRALILEELDIPISKSLLENTYPAKLFLDASALAEEARKLSEDIRLPSNIKTALSVMAGDLAGINNYSLKNNELSALLTETVAVWASETTPIITDKAPQKTVQFQTAVMELISSLNSFKNTGIKNVENLERILGKFYLSAGVSSNPQVTENTSVPVISEKINLLNDKLIRLVNIFPDISALAENISKFSEDIKLSPELKTALSVIAGDLDGINNYSPKKIELNELLSKTAIAWASETAAIISDKTPQQKEQFQSALKELISSLNSFKDSGIKNTENLERILGKFYLDTGVLAIKPQVTENTSVPVISEKINLLNDKLLRLTGLFADDSALSNTGSRSTSELAGIIRKTGMSYEWMMLAWYRSGRDPIKIKEFINSNLKGIIANFLDNVGKEASKKDYTAKKITGIIEKAQSIFNEIESRQIGNILNEAAEKRGFFFELPIGMQGDGGSAKMWVRGEKEKGSNTIEPGYFNLDFELDTTDAGLIKGNLSSVGKNVSIKFRFGDEKVRLAAESLSKEFRDSLTSKGLSVGALDFSDISEVSSGSTNPNVKSGLDISG